MIFLLFTHAQVLVFHTIPLFVETRQLDLRWTLLGIFVQDVTKMKVHASTRVCLIGFVNLIFLWAKLEKVYCLICFRYSDCVTAFRGGPPFFCLPQQYCSILRRVVLNKLLPCIL